MIVPVATAAFLSSCAPTVGVATMAAVVEYESGWKPWAIADNTVRRSYFLQNRSQAVAVASALLGEGHNIDVGLAQVNSSNFGAYGLTPASALDPCTNLRAGSAILTRNYERAIRENWIGHAVRSRNDRYYQQQYALIHALSAYNSGRYWASMRYAVNVYELAKNVRIEFANTGVTRS